MSLATSLRNALSAVGLRLRSATASTRPLDLARGCGGPSCSPAATALPARMDADERLCEADRKPASGAVRRERGLSSSGGWTPRARDRARPPSARQGLADKSLLADRRADMGASRNDFTPRLAEATPRLAGGSGCGRRGAVVSCRSELAHEGMPRVRERRPAVNGGLFRTKMAASSANISTTPSTEFHLTLQSASISRPEASSSTASSSQRSPSNFTLPLHHHPQDIPQICPNCGNVRQRGLLWETAKI